MRSTRQKVARSSYKVTVNPRGWGKVMNQVVRFRSPEQLRRAHVSVPNQPRRPLRRAELPAEDPVLAPTDDVLNCRISEELDFAWQQLELAVIAMHRDALTKARHGTALKTSTQSAKRLVNWR